MKEFKRYTGKQFKSLFQHLKEFKKSKDVETLHDIRVNVKRIKAILQLLKFSDSDFKAHKAFIPFRTIFRRAGEIRDPEVHAGLLLKFNVTGVKKLGSDKNSILTFIKDIAALKENARVQIKKIKSMARKVSRKDLKKFLERQEKEIRSRLYPKPEMKEIHKVRKAMKSLVYLAEIDSLIPKKTIAFYHKMEAAIGEFHDQQVVLGMLSDAPKGEDDTNRKIILRECRDSSERIKKLSQKFYKSKK